MATGEYKIVQIKREIEFEIFNDEHNDEKCGVVESNTEDANFNDLSKSKCKAEEINNEGNRDLHYANIKTEVVENKPKVCEDVNSETNFFIKFGNECGNSVISIPKESMTQIKTENDGNVFDDDEYGSLNNLKDQSNLNSKYEVHKEEKYVAVQLTPMDVDCTYSSRIQSTSKQIKSELNGNIYNGYVKTKLVDKMQEKCGKRLVDCKVCLKAFTTTGRLKRHEKIHTGEKPFCCKICSKAFIESSTLKRHEKIHTGEKPFHCKICSKAFTFSGNLKNHQRIHTGERPFHCKICSKAFIESSNLKRHEKIHTGEKPFHCKICSKSFVRSSHLKVHERIHTGEKPYQCKFCSNAFSQLYNLKEHEKIHTGEKPFHCKVCSKAFARSNTLKFHEKIHTRQKVEDISQTDAC